MEELLMVLTQGIVDDCESRIKARLKELGDENLFNLIKTYAKAVGLIENFKFKEEMVNEIEKEIGEKLKERND